MSTTLPRRMNFLNPSSIGFLPSLEWKINVSGGIGLVKQGWAGAGGSSEP
jgi:hypothetical protein